MAMGRIDRVPHFARNPYTIIIEHSTTENVPCLRYVSYPHFLGLDRENKIGRKVLCGGTEAMRHFIRDTP